MSIDSRSDITYEAEKAYNNYKSGEGTKADFFEAVGGAKKGVRIEKILSFIDPIDARRETEREKDNSTSNPLPNSSLISRRSSGVKNLFNREKNTERVPRQRTTERTPPIIALLLSFVIGMGMFVSDVYSNLGILLIAFAIGFHALSLFWLEILTLPRFKNRKDVAWTWRLWSLLLVISIFSSIVIIGIDLIPSTNSIKYSLLLSTGEPFWDSNGNGIYDKGTNGLFESFTDLDGDGKYDGPGTIHPSMKMALIFQVISNLFLITSMKDVTKFRNKLIRSPWTIASLVSLISVSLPILFIRNTSWINDLTWTQDLMLINFSAIIIGSSAMIYGRSANSNSLTTAFSVILPSLVGYAILVQLGNSAELREFPIITTYLAFPLFLNLITWIIPSNEIKINSKDDDTQHSKLIISNILIFIILVSCIIYLSLQSNRMYLTLTPLLFSYAILSREHTTRVGGSTLKVHSIIARDTKEDNLNNKKIKLKFSILGATATGKTSFAAALWTLLQTRELRNIWWSEEIFIEDHKILNDHKDGTNGKNLEALAKGRGDTDEGNVADMLQARIAKSSCKNWIKNQDFPTPTKNTPFPFTVQSFGYSEQKLNDFKKLLVDPDNRALPETTTTPGKITMTMNFHADVEIMHPSFLLGRTLQNKDKREICEIELDIETWDINGESFSAAVRHTRDFYNSNAQRFSQSIMKPVKQSELDAQHGGSNLSPVKASDVEDARKLFLDSSHTFLIVDTKDLLDNGDEKGVEDYIRLMRKIHKEGGGKLERLQILLNKADELFVRNDEYCLRRWEDMNDREKSEKIINDTTNHAFSQLRSAGMDVEVGFTCTFGGLVPEIGENMEMVVDRNTGDIKLLAPYPMLPVNVLEPFIDVILDSNLVYDDI